jgi:hypothetical protein
MKKASGATRSRLYLFQLKNVNVTVLDIAKADAMLLLQTILICPYKGKMAEVCPKTLKIIYYHTQYYTVTISSLLKLKKLFQVIIAPLVVMLLLLGSSMLIAIPANSQLLSENAGASAVSLSPTSSANQSGTIGSLQASEVVSFEGQQSNQSFVNQTTISRLREATDESFETFEIPTTNRNISGPESMTSQASLSGNNISAFDSENVQNRSNSLPSSIGNSTDVFQREEQVEGNVFGNITMPRPPTPSTMIESHKIDVVPLDLRDMVGETSVASNNNDLIFYTGNFYAARSTDAGKTWQYINASEDFEDFCCDQRVIYDDPITCSYGTDRESLMTLLMRTELEWRSLMIL